MELKRTSRINLQSAGAGDYSLFIDLQAREWCRLATSSNDNVLTAQSALTTLKQVNLDFILVDKASGALNVIDAVLPIWNWSGMSTRSQRRKEPRTSTNTQHPL